MTGVIHDEHPFATPPDLRDPARQLRGRLASGVTVVTAGDESGQTGLTVSSLLVAEGQPSRVVLLLGEVNDLWDVVQRTSRFVMHVLEGEDRAWSDRFAGLRPSPGGLFAGLEVIPGAWGPVVAPWPTRAFCTVEQTIETGNFQLVVAVADQIELTDVTDPLVFFRGRYRTLAP